MGLGMRTVDGMERANERKRQRRKGERGENSMASIKGKVIINETKENEINIS